MPDPSSKMYFESFTSEPICGEVQRLYSEINTSNVSSATILSTWHFLMGSGFQWSLLKQIKMASILNHKEHSWFMVQGVRASLIGLDSDPGIANQLAALPEGFNVYDLDSRVSTNSTLKRKGQVINGVEISKYGEYYVTIFKSPKSHLVKK